MCMYIILDRKYEENMKKIEIKIIEKIILI